MVFLRAMGAAVGEAAPASSSRAEPRTIQLPVQRLTADSFRPFGQVRFILISAADCTQQGLVSVSPDFAMITGHLCK